MDISVILPALNEEKKIGKSIESVLNQDFKGKYEVIVSDGKSTDRTAQIAKDYGVKCVIGKKRNIAYQRNYGASFAEGKILAFLDSDTTASPKWLQSIYESFQNKNTVAVSGPVFPLEEEVNKGPYRIINNMQKIVLMLNMPILWGFSCAFKKASFDKIRGFDEYFETAQDYDISLRIKNHGKVVLNKKMLVYTSHRRFRSKKDYVDYVVKVMNFLLLKTPRTYKAVR